VNLFERERLRVALDDGIEALLRRGLEPPTSIREAEVWANELCRYMSDRIERALRAEDIHRFAYRIGEIHDRLLPGHKAAAE
jgi:hypothetical protein